MRTALSVSVLTVKVLAAFRKVVWGSSIAKDPPTVTHEEAMTDQGLYKWLSKVVSGPYIHHWSAVFYFDAPR